MNTDEIKTPNKYDQAAAEIFKVLHKVCLEAEKGKVLDEALYLEVSSTLDKALECPKFERIQLDLSKQKSRVS